MLIQMIKFAIVGAVATIIDVCVLVALKELFLVDVLVASAVSFSVSVTVNYLLSMAYVFKGKKQSKLAEFVIFVALSIGGLLLNQLILWLGVTFTSMYYLIVKALAIIIVLVYNFITRKLFLESK